MIRQIKDRFTGWRQRRRAVDVFTNWADSYESDVSQNSYSAAAAVRGAVAPLIVPGCRVTDLGIGTGLIWADMELPEDMAVTGLDISAAMLEQASSHPDLGPLYLCDVGRSEWPVGDESQDAVVAAGLFEYLTEAMAEHVFDQASTVLKLGGDFIFTYIPAETNETRIWDGKSGRILSCRFAPAWIESRPGFAVKRHDPAFAGSVFADGTSYDYRLAVLTKTS